MVRSKKIEEDKPSCPKCGSTHLQAVSETHTHGKIKGFGVGKGCLGTLLIGPFGWLCGLCGMGKGSVKSTTSTKRMCMKCGNKF